MRCVAFLRGINVGSRRPKKDELVAAVAGPELADVSTYQASGNVLFETDRDAGDLEALLEPRIEERLAYDVACFVRTLDELRAIIDDLPELGDGEKHQIVFFKDPPTDELREAFADAAGSTDSLVWHGRELLWTHRGGLLDSSLGAALQRLVPPPHTVRTGATVERLVAKLVQQRRPGVAAS